MFDAFHAIQFLDSECPILAEDKLGLTNLQSKSLFLLMHSGLDSIYTHPNALYNSVETKPKQLYDDMGKSFRAVRDSDSPLLTTKEAVRVITKCQEEFKP